jgi:hypothetical protein
MWNKLRTPFDTHSSFNLVDAFGQINNAQFVFAIKEVIEGACMTMTFAYFKHLFLNICICSFFNNFSPVIYQHMQRSFHFLMILDKIDDFNIVLDFLSPNKVI